MVLVSKGDKLCEIHTQDTNGRAGLASKASYADSMVPPLG